MSLFFWIPPVVLVLISGAWSLYYAPEFRKAARLARNKRAFGIDSNKIHYLPMIEKELFDGEVFGGIELKESVDKLIEYARKLNPDWIAGIQPGGLVLASYICEKLNIGSRKCLYMQKKRGGDDFDIIMPDEYGGSNTGVSGTLLVIDDISRTGIALYNVRNTLISRNGDSDFRLNLVKFACLLVVDNFIEKYTDSYSGGSRFVFNPDWVYKRTIRQMIKFPWTTETHRLYKIYCDENSSEDDMFEYCNFIKQATIPLSLARRSLG